MAMKEWITGAINSLKEKNGLTGDHEINNEEVICSRAYISCALKIGHSLADELSAVEEQRAYDISYDEGGRDMFSTNKSSWSQFISVNCEARTKLEDIDGSQMNESDRGLSDLEPIPYCNVSETEDLQMLNAQLSSWMRTDSPPVEAEVDYLRVQGASLEEYAMERKHICGMYSLGLLFFELFSGGQIPADELGKLHQSLTRLPAAAEKVSLHSTSHRSSYSEDELCGSEGGDSNRIRKLQCSDPTPDAPSPKTLRTLSDSILVEPLKSLGLPTALCDLIRNMVNSTSGDVVGDETYHSMSDLRDDLKLMIDSPDVYLQDIDMVQAVSAGLQWESSGNEGCQTCFYGREAELETLKESYHRSISSNCEVAMICAPSGMGKSRLSEVFAEYVTAPAGNDGSSDGGIYLSGRFDRLQQSHPFHAISSAFDKYCSWLSVDNRSTAKQVSSALKEGFGEEVSSLVTLMPNLAGILGNDFASSDKNESDDGAVNKQMRLRYLFCQFVEIISRCHKKPLVLFLDDCQWIDAASAGLLIQLMMAASSMENHRFFFFGCYRDDEVNEEHPLTSMLTSMGTFGTKTTKICLTSMSKDTANEMVSTTLSLLPRLTRPLANILHHKTKGSPLFIEQLMTELYKQRLLYPSLIRRRWIWDLEKIVEMKIPESVAVFIKKSFNRLPSEVLSALSVLSCLGASADISLIKTLEVEIHTPLSDPLDVAVAESIVDKRNGTYYFAHDKLQEAAYTAIKAEVRCLQHFSFGLSLGFVAAREKDDNLLITAVTQINHGGPKAVIDKEQGVAVASLNLDAGKKAMAMSDFFSAYSFFDHGISYLRRGHWTEHYDLSLELFNLAAKCAFTNADYTSLEVLTGQILHSARCLEDKCHSISLSIAPLIWSGDITKAITVTTITLSRLGEELPAVVTAPFIQSSLDETKAMLSGLSDETILGYPVMTNRTKALAIELLAKLMACVVMAATNKNLASIIPLKMVQLSLTYGMGPHSNLGFVHYGNYLAFCRGEYEEGYRYVKMALTLGRRNSTVNFFSTHTKMIIEPMQSTVEFYLEASKAAMKSGTPGVPASLCSYEYLSFFGGKKLDATVESLKESIKQIKFHKGLGFVAVLLSMFRLAMRMIDQPGIPENGELTLTDASGKTLDEIDIAAKFKPLALSNSFNNAYEALLFRDFDKAKESTEAFFSIQKDETLIHDLGMPTFYREFYLGLISFWVGREINDSKWISRGTRSKSELEKLAVSASAWNFENKAYLLHAEEQFSQMNFADAEELYDAAISSSKKHKFVNEEALANELAGRFYLETDRRSRSIPYFSQALEKYKEWGAVAKVRELANFVDGSGSA